MRTTQNSIEPPLVARWGVGEGESLSGFSGPWTPRWMRHEKRKMANTWERYSPKANRIVRVYGDLRYKLWLWLESASWIAALCEEPAEYRATINGQVINGGFDFWCRTTGGEELFVDAFYSDRIGLGSSSKIAAATFVATERALRYAVCTEKVLWRDRMGPANWSIILSYLADFREAPNSDLGIRLRQYLETKGALPLSTIEQQFPTESSGILRSALFREVHTGRVTADLEQSLLGARTVFSPLL